MEKNNKNRYVNFCYDTNLNRDLDAYLLKTHSFFIKPALKLHDQFLIMNKTAYVCVA